MKNEKGMIFPLTIIILFLFLLIFTHQINLFLSERRFLEENQALEQLENLLQMGFRDVTEELAKMDQLDRPLRSTLQYPSGLVDYSLSPETLHVVKVVIICRDNSGRRDRVDYYYDLAQKKVLQWVEIY